MTLNSLKEYTAISQIFTGILQNSGMDNFVTSFQTFAPTISSEIVSYYFDNSCSCQNKIIFYTELYKDESIEFLYDYATENNLGDLVDSLMLNTIRPYISLSGKIASVKIEDWATFAAKASNATFNSFSTILSGDNVLVFFI
jgi:hypothetical protein